MAPTKHGAQRARDTDLRPKSTIRKGGRTTKTPLPAPGQQGQSPVRSIRRIRPKTARVFVPPEVRGRKEGPASCDASRCTCVRVFVHRYFFNFSIPIFEFFVACELTIRPCAPLRRKKTATMAMPGTTRPRTVPACERATAKTRTLSKLPSIRQALYQNQYISSGTARSERINYCVRADDAPWALTTVM